MTYWRNLSAKQGIKHGLRVIQASPSASSPKGLAEATLLGLRHRPSGMAGGATALYKAVLHFALTRMRKEPRANFPGLFCSSEALFTTLGFGTKSVKTRPSSFPHAGQMISSHSRFSSTTDLSSHPIVLLHLSQTPTVSYKPPQYSHLQSAQQATLL